MLGDMPIEDVNVFSEMRRKHDGGRRVVVGFVQDGG
jgi:hypothetical protein